MEGKLIWPVAGSAPITQGFGGNPQTYARFGLAGHNGLDFGVPPGTPVRAAAAGIVQHIASQPEGYGCYVRLIHGGGRETLYAHLQAADVQTGQEVTAAQVVGWSGNSGFSSAPHLHFELRLAGQAGNGFGGAVDPLPLLMQQAKQPQLAGEYGLRCRAAVDLNLRLSPSFSDTLRGRLRSGDVVSLAGSQQSAAGGFTFVPVVLWVAREYLLPLADEGLENGQQGEDFHILPALSTELRGLSTVFAHRPASGWGAFPLVRAAFPLSDVASRWPGCGPVRRFSTILSTGGQDAG